MIYRVLKLNKSQSKNMAGREKLTESLQHDRPLKKPDFKCLENHKIEKFCANDLCRFNALCCREQQCKSCTSAHQNCLFGQFFQLNKRVQNRIKIQKSVFKDLFNVENEFFENLQMSRNDISKQGIFWAKSGKASNLINRIYLEKNIKEIDGADMNMLFNQLSTAEWSQKIKKCIETYKKQTNRLLNEFITYRQFMIESIFTEQYSPGDVDKESQKSIESVIDLQQDQDKDQRSQYDLDSINKVLKDKSSDHSQKKESNDPLKEIDSGILLKDREGRQMLAYLSQELGNPKHLQLLFRASQHNFSSYKFHEICDNIRKTVTIIRTGFHKTLVGYTENPWTSCNSFVPDRQRKSFLLQLDLKQKMVLQKKNTQSLFDNLRFGPSFGCDIVLSNECNANKYSYTKFPYSFNGVKQYKKDRQEVWTSFCGSIDGNYFSVIQYEVFQVIQ